MQKHLFESRSDATIIPNSTKSGGHFSGSKFPVWLNIWCTNVGLEIVGLPLSVRLKPYISDMMFYNWSMLANVTDIQGRIHVHKNVGWNSRIYQCLCGMIFDNWSMCARTINPILVSYFRDYYSGFEPDDEEAGLTYEENSGVNSGECSS